MCRCLRRVNYSFACNRCRTRFQRLRSGGLRIIRAPKPPGGALLESCIRKMRAQFVHSDRSDNGAARRLERSGFSGKPRYRIKCEAQRREEIFGGQFGGIPWGVVCEGDTGLKSCRRAAACPFRTENCWGLQEFKELPILWPYCQRLTPNPRDYELLSSNSGWAKFNLR